MEGDLNSAPKYSMILANIWQHHLRFKEGLWKEKYLGVIHGLTAYWLDDLYLFLLFKIGA